MPLVICACIGERTQSELAPKQQEFVVAMTPSDKATSARLRGELSVVEKTQVASGCQDARPLRR